MKSKIILAVMIALLLATMTSCLGPRFSNEEQYDRGDWGGWANPDQVARIKQDRLAIAKIQATPVQVAYSTNGVPLGYLGVIANESPGRALLFKYSGPEHGADYLDKGQYLVKPLLPGTYLGEIFDGGDRVGWVTFVSEPVVKTYRGLEVHWIFGSK